MSVTYLQHMSISFFNPGNAQLGSAHLDCEFKMHQSKTFIMQGRLPHPPPPSLPIGVCVGASEFAEHGVGRHVTFDQAILNIQP